VTGPSHGRMCSTARRGDCDIPCYDADGGEDHGAAHAPDRAADRGRPDTGKSANAVFAALAAASHFGQSNRPIVSTSITVRTKRPQMSAPEHAAAAPAA
jgi:hypothetical protein